jgi:hypothetical protein
MERCSPPLPAAVATMATLEATQYAHDWRKSAAHGMSIPPKLISNYVDATPIRLERN